MEENKTLFAVIKSESDKIKIIIKNVLTMLSNRIYIDKNGNKNHLLNENNFGKNVSDKGDGTFVIKTNNDDIYAVKIIFQRITSTGKQSIISDFFKEYPQHKKIIIAKEYNNKIVDYMGKNHTQIFKENILLTNIIDYRDQPKFELLSPSEMEKVKLEYHITEYTTNKMLRSDPISKYYALKKGDIIRIIRPSPTSGESIAYRIVA